MFSVKFQTICSCSDTVDLKLILLSLLIIFIKQRVTRLSVSHSLKFFLLLSFYPLPQVWINYFWFLFDISNYSNNIFSFWLQLLKSQYFKYKVFLYYLSLVQHTFAITQRLNLFLVIIIPISAKAGFEEMQVTDAFKWEHTGQISLPVNCTRERLVINLPGLAWQTNTFWNECCPQHCPPLFTNLLSWVYPTSNYFRLQHPGSKLNNLQDDVVSPWPYRFMHATWWL